MGEAAEPTTDQRPPSFQPTRVTELLYSPTNRKRRSLSYRARAYSEIGCRSHRGRYRNRYRNRLLLSTRRPIVDSDTDPDPEQTADTQISMPLRGMTGIPLPHPQCRKRSPLRVNLLCALRDFVVHPPAGRGGTAAGHPPGVARRARSARRPGACGCSSYISHPLCLRVSAVNCKFGDASPRVPVDRTKHPSIVQPREN
jgi:hypothetical protein